MPKAVAQKTGATAKVTAKKSTAKRKGNGYQMPERIPIGTILTDLSKQQWKIGPSIGVGGFGEIYCACKANEAPKKHEDYQYVVKVVRIWRIFIHKLSFRRIFLIIFGTGTAWQWSTIR